MLSFKYENIYTRNIICLIIVFGIAYLGFTLMPKLPGMPNPSAMQLLSYLAGNYFLLLINNHIIVRTLFLKGKYLKALLGAFAIGTVLFLFSYYLGNLYNIPQNIASEILGSFVKIIVGACIYLGHNYFVTNVLNTQKKLLNTGAELDFLKQQLSPHFLLNSLNNLYGVSLTAPEIIPDKIIELSQLLSYQVAATNKQIVSITDEIKFVNDYLNNAKYKANNLKLNITTEGNIGDENIAPLLFLPLIENAIKFSLETDEPYINADWILKSDTTQLSIENNYQTEIKTKQGNNIGIANLKRRLEILQLKNIFTSDTTLPHIYKTQLTIWHSNTNV
jgi:two-component system, LytTR family, sensor kinase